MNLIERYYLHTRSPFAELTRFFFDGLLRPEWMNQDGSFQTRLIQILSAIFCAGIFFPRELRRTYAILHALPDPVRYRVQASSDWMLAMLLISLIVAVWTVMQWRSLFPSGRDHMILTPQPVSRSQLFGAKLAALLIFVTLFILVLNLTCGITLPAVASGRWEPRPLWLRVAALLAGSIGLAYFPCLALLALQGVLMAILSIRWFESVSFLVQALLLFALLCAFPLISYLPVHEAVATIPPWLEWFPPGWFWALAERIAGSRNPAIVHLASRAEASLLLAAFIAATSYVISYVQFNRYALEIVGARSGPLMDWSALFARLFPSAQSRGVSEFVLRTLLRGRQQKLTVVLIAGMGVALVVDGWFNANYVAPRHQTALSVMREAVVSMPLTLSFFSLLAVRRAFRTPSTLPANWIFRFFETRAATRQELNSMFLTFLLIAGVPPIAACGLIEWAVFGRDAIAILLVESLMMVAFAEYLFRNWCSIPFTFLLNPARRHFIQSASIHLGEFTIYSLISGFIVLRGTIDHSVWMVQATIACVLVFWFDRQRRAAIANAPLEFTEPASDAIEVLRLLD